MNNKKTTNNKNYTLPPVELLDHSEIDMDYHGKNDREKAAKFESIFAQYGASIKVIKVDSGLRVTRYEFTPINGTRIIDIISLVDDVKLNYCGRAIRIEKQVPGKAAMAFEICDNHFDLFRLRNVIEDDGYKSDESITKFAVGMGLDKKIVYSDLKKVENLLVTGTTGTGKTTFMQSFILNLLYKANPDELKMAIIDTKCVEYYGFIGLPHLLQRPICSIDKAYELLESLKDEIHDRHNIFLENGVKSIDQYNSLMKNKNMTGLPKIVLIVDEFAELMLIDQDRFMNSIVKLLQVGRLSGIYVVLSTQLNSSKIKPLIRANVKGVLRFSAGENITSSEDSLMGMGDILYSADTCRHFQRLQGMYVSSEEQNRIVDYITVHNAGLRND